MRRISVGMIFLLGIAAVVFAQAAVFHTADATVNSAGALVVSWDERGLGNGGTDGLVHYTLTADAHATYGCINGGGNHPKATNKETVNGPVSAMGTFSSGKNGSISQSLTLEPPSPGS